MTQTEYRFAPVELRAGGAGPGTVEGVAVRYGDEARLPGFRERFAPGAFGNVAALDVVANVQHERGRPLARTGGGGLTLADDTANLRAALELPATRDGEDAAELLRRGVLAGFSVEFQVGDERFEAGVRVVERARLIGLALVDRPAYGDSLAAIAKRAAASVEPRRRRRMAVTVEQAAVALRVSVDQTDLAGGGPDNRSRVLRLLSVAQATVERHAPGAPEDVRDEAVIRTTAWLFDSVGFGAGEARVLNTSGALSKSGAASLLRPWRTHRAGAC